MMRARTDDDNDDQDNNDTDKESGAENHSVSSMLMLGQGDKNEDSNEDECNQAGMTPMDIPTSGHSEWHNCTSGPNL